VSSPLERAIDAATRGETQPVYLVLGDLVLAEPAATRLGDALGKAFGAAPDSHRRPARLVPILEDLRTFSLFTPAKVSLVVDAALFADRSVAAELLADALEASPAGGGGDLAPKERQAAARLLQALRLFGVDPYEGDAAQAIARLPEAAFQSSGGGKKRKIDAAQREALAALLRAAREAELEGWGESDVAELARLVQSGLPKGHALVLVERAAAPDHPVVATLAEQGAVFRVGEVASERGGGFTGLDRLAAELERQTGVAIARDALDELSRRTLRTAARSEEVDSDSTTRFAGEYRKLAELALSEVAGAAGAAGDRPRRIERRMVEDAVEDRGEEDVWKLLDALAEGKGGVVLSGIERMLRNADDPMAARLSFFSLLSSFCRQMMVVGGMIDLQTQPRGVTQYNRFKDQIAPRLQGPLPGSRDNPIARLHPFRLHRVYLAASRAPREFLNLLPAKLLDLELRLKGEASDPQAALAAWIGELQQVLGPVRIASRGKLGGPG
jgi:hypothetical protein